MSKTLTNVVKYWEDLELRLLGDGEILSDWEVEDRATMIQSLVLNNLIFEDTLQSDFSQQMRRDLTTWTYYVLRRDPVLCSITSGQLLNWLLNVPRSVFGHQAIAAWERFKASYGDAGKILSLPIRGEIREYLVKGTPAALMSCNQFLSGPWKVNYPSLDYSDRCLSEYYEQEERNKNLSIDPVLVRSLNQIMIEWCSQGLDFEDLHPKHGNGSVAEVGIKHVVEKYDHIGTDVRLRYSFPDSFGASITGEVDRSCRIIFVPKSIKTWRVISAEPASLMFHQQAVLAVFDKWFQRNHILRSHIRLHDDSFNRGLAKRGSLSSEPTEPNSATIDLSAASDSVTWQLVKGVFAHTKMLRYLVSTRSTHAILPNGDKLELFKFAPMGSAVCFPVETVIFSACCELIQRVYGNKRTSTYAVYGDDIIIDTTLVNPLISLLERLGLTVNLSKSFTSRDIPFRESCGGEFVGGVDVTPLRLPRNFVALSQSTLHRASVFSMGLSLCNRLGQRECRKARSFIIRKFLQLPKHLRPLFTDDGQGGSIISNAPTNFHLKEIKDQNARRWQGHTFRHGSIRAETDFWFPDDDWGHTYLYEWLRSCDRRRALNEPVFLQRASVTARVVTSRTTIT